MRQDVMDETEHSKDEKLPEESMQEHSDATETTKNVQENAQVIAQGGTQLDPLGEVEVRRLARARARRSLDLAKMESTREAEEDIPVKRVGWVDVPGEVLLEWWANPWSARPMKLLLLTVSYVALFAFACWIAPQDYFLLAIIPIVLFASASSHLVPSRYIITTEGIYWANFMDMMFRPWLVIEDYIFGDEMAELFFDKRSVRARIQRSIPVYYGKKDSGKRDEIENLVRRLHSEKWELLREEVRNQAETAEQDDEISESLNGKEGEYV